MDDEIDVSDFYKFEEIDWLIHSLSRYFSALQAVLFDVRKSKTKSMYLVYLLTEIVSFNMISTSLRKSIGWFTLYQGIDFMLKHSGKRMTLVVFSKGNVSSLTLTKSQY